MTAAFEEAADIGKAMLNIRAQTIQRVFIKVNACRLLDLDGNDQLPDEYWQSITDDIRALPRRFAPGAKWRGGVWRTSGQRPHCANFVATFIGRYWPVLTPSGLSLNLRVAYF